MVSGLQGSVLGTDACGHTSSRQADTANGMANLHVWSVMGPGGTLEPCSCSHTPAVGGGAPVAHKDGSQRSQHSQACAAVA